MENVFEIDFFRFRLRLKTKDKKVPTFIGLATTVLAHLGIMVIAEF